MTIRAQLRTLLVAAGAVLVVAAGCSDSVPKRNTKPKPAIQSLQKTSVAVGEQFPVRGTNFLRTKGETKLKFKGEFRARDGSSSPVDVTVPLAVDTPEDAPENSEKRIGVWLRFGPFTNPFSDKGQVGKFVGTVRPVNVYYNEEGEKTQTVRGAARSTKVRVEPSLEIVELQPKHADCGAPAIRGFAGPDYRIKVRAVGFAPKRFEWRISSIVDGETIGTKKTFYHPATGPTDTLGDDKGETIDFEPVPEGTKHYVAGIQVRAEDRATGKYVHTSLPFGIHRPVEVQAAGPFEVAQHYRPEPVTACIPGAIGNKATYSETETEVRQRTVSVGVSQSFARSRMSSRSVNWQRGYSVTNTRSRTQTRAQSRTRTETTAQTESHSYNKSRSNSFKYGTTRGESWGVGGETTVHGKVMIPEVAEGGVEQSFNYNKSWSKQTSKEWGSTVTTGESHSFSKSYTLSDSVTSSYSYSDTKSRSKSRTYNFGASATSSKRVTQGITESEKNTWMRSKSSSTLTQYSAFIPPEKFGVFYRQTIRMVRRAELVAFDACGEMRHMGEIQLNSWNWAPDLATGKDCREELPEPNLPPAKCHIKPCD